MLMIQQFRLWCLAEDDLLSSTHQYTLTQTGQVRYNHDYTTACLVILSSVHILAMPLLHSTTALTLRCAVQLQC
jgi:hypothetical protein